MKTDIIQSLVVREENESDKEYSAFLHYAILSEDNRTIAIETIAPSISQKSGLASELIADTQKKFFWDKRLTIVDQHLFMESIKKRREMLEKDAKDFVMESKQFTKKGMEMVSKLYNLAEDLLRTANLANKVIETGHVITKDGREVPTHTVIQMNARVSDIKGLIECAVKLPQMLASMPNRNINNTMNILNVIKNIDAKSDEDIESAERQLEDEIQKLLKGGTVDGEILDAGEIDD
jgi:hypothetical protein